MARRDQVVLDSHELECFHSGFFSLGNVDVHFVPIEVCVIWRTTALVESERSPRQDASAVTHDGYPVQGRLAVEQYSVAVNEVPEYNVSNLEILGDFLLAPAQVLLQTRAVGGADDAVIRPWPLSWTIGHHGLEARHVVGSYTLGVGKIHRNEQRDGDLVNTEVGIGGDYCAAAVVHTLA